MHCDISYKEEDMRGAHLLGKRKQEGKPRKRDLAKFSPTGILILNF
jgi:hypothetical protein